MSPICSRHTQRPHSALLYASLETNSLALVTWLCPLPLVISHGAHLVRPHSQVTSHLFTAALRGDGCFTRPTTKDHSSFYNVSCVRSLTHSLSCVLRDAWNRSRSDMTLVSVLLMCRGSIFASMSRSRVGFNFKVIYWCANVKVACKELNSVHSAFLKIALILKQFVLGHTSLNV